MRMACGFLALIYGPGISLPRDWGVNFTTRRDSRSPRLDHRWLPDSLRAGHRLGIAREPGELACDQIGNILTKHGREP